MADLAARLTKDKGFYEVFGVIDTLKPQLIYAMGRDARTKLVITFDELRAKSLLESYSFFDEGVLYYPARDLLFYQSDIHSNDQTRERLRVAEALMSGEPVTIITTIDALMNKVPPMDSYRHSLVKLAPGDEVDLAALRKQLVAMGYEAVSQVEQPGQFAVRGGILDVFPLTEPRPVRLELWGDEVDSLRSFDPTTQKSLDNLQQLQVYPSSELVLTAKELNAGLKAMEKEAEAIYKDYRAQMKTEEAHRLKSTITQLVEETREWGPSSALENYLGYFTDEAVSLLSYFPEDTLVYLDELGHLQEKGQLVESEFSDSMTRRLEKGYCLPKQLHSLIAVAQVFAQVQSFRGLILSTLDSPDGLVRKSGKVGLRAASVGSYNRQFDLLIKDLKRFAKNKYRMLLLSPSRTRAKHLAELIMDEDLPVFYTEDYDHHIHPGEIMVAQGNLSRGYEFPEVNFVILSEQDIFGSIARKRKRPRIYEGEKIASFTELNVGDYVVHENHGLAIYQGFEKLELEQVQKDYIKLLYAKGDVLYIPVTQMDTIQKYSSADGKHPKLNTLGGKEWHATKERVRSAVGVVAKELVDLYAARQEEDGYVYGPDTVWQQEFEETFPYEETEGQLLAIDAVKRDMMSTKIMDRLICGDVGYGKTEIALRAAFKAVQEGKQVVYLVPTTILAQQHYNTFLQRMAQYPVNIGLLCRFVSDADQRKIIKQLKSGEMDIVIGTHRLLSADVGYKDLGLLIIDEEQRFGVNHKEKIKQLKRQVDVMSLSATPIPRTLHMSLIGIRDMSVLEEAPQERQPIQTFVFEYNEELVREAIVREMARGGQVYYVYNRVNTIAEATAAIAELVPEANVAYAHGKMTEARLEKIMYGFINQEIDVLVSTTIIEIGLDISNVNTIIIHDSDQLGLSQLYQLRGRVGRSNRTAYAFLMYRRDKLLKEVAEKRLSAIKEFTELGSGFKIAMRDLEIRGAGNLLGAEQHGHMTAVGYDLYCKMLNEAVKREKGLVHEENFDTVIDLELDAFLPESYVPGELQRLDLYKRIAELASIEEKEDLLDELIDRFGEPPKAVTNLLFVAMLRQEAHKAYALEVKQRADEVVIAIFDRAPIDPTGIPALVERHSPYLRFAVDANKPAFHYAYRANSRIRPKDLPEIVMNLLKELQELSASAIMLTNSELKKEN